MYPSAAPDINNVAISFVYYVLQMMDELALAPSPSGSLDLEVQEVVEEEVDVGKRGFKSSTKFRT